MFTLPWMLGFSPELTAQGHLHAPGSAELAGSWIPPPCLTLDSQGRSFLSPPLFLLEETDGPEGPSWLLPHPQIPPDLTPQTS